MLRPEPVERDMATSRADQLREASNPLFSKRRLKLGTFCSNLSRRLRDLQDRRRAQG